MLFRPWICVHRDEGSKYIQTTTHCGMDESLVWYAPTHFDISELAEILKNVAPDSAAMVLPIIVLPVPADQ